ncbi:MAG: hypothetical protein PHH00_03860 [Candidatus Nanoarchaeia archaeon]|nr:hypothetical protein [Candidatus Nanoarchaeia archaeon]
MLLRDYAKNIPDIARDPRDMECQDDDLHDEDERRYKEIGKIIRKMPLGVPSCRARGQVNVD